MRLSKDECVLLRMFANGYTYADIATILGFNERTIRRNSDVLFAKLDARNPPHAVGIGFKEGFLIGQDVADPAIYAHLKVSPREKDVFTLLGRDYSKESIMKQLGISDDTFRICRSRMCKKLGVASDAEAIAILKMHNKIQV